MARSIFVFGTDYTNQSTEEMCTDFVEIIGEARQIKRESVSVHDNSIREGNRTLWALYQSVFLFADRIIDTRSAGKNEIGSGKPSALLIKTLIDLGCRAHEYSNTLGEVWSKERGYQTYKEGSPELFWYKRLRDFCNSMTDLNLIGNELERRFMRNGQILTLNEEPLTKVWVWLLDNIFAVVVTGVLIAALTFYLGLT